MSEVKPCPACESNDVGLSFGNEQVVCHDCLMKGPESETCDKDEAIAAWNALPRREKKDLIHDYYLWPADVYPQPPLRWTKEYPTKPGWYWYRRIYDKHTFDCHVKIWQDNYRNLKVESHQFDPTAESLWAGPIPEPLD